MRLDNKCDYMNVTGCTELHNWERVGTGLKHFLYTNQIECGLILGILLVGLFIYFKFVKNAKDGMEEKK